MELKEAIRILRKECKMTQDEFAQKLHFSNSTIKRWEAGRTIPDTTAVHRLIDFANGQDVSEQCQYYLHNSLVNSRKYTINLPNSDLYSVERESICQLVDDSLNAVYVTDMETNQLLYVNHKAEEFIGKTFHIEKLEKCYEYVFNRKEPCLQCPKNILLTNELSEVHFVSAKTGRRYHVNGQKLNWNGKPAHAQFFFDETNALETQNGFHKLVDQIGMGICILWVYDDGNIQMNYMNDGYFSIIGSSREKRAKYAGYGVVNAIFEEDREQLMSRVKKASRLQKSFCARYRVVNDDGMLVECYVRAKFIRYEAGKSVYYCTIINIDNLDTWNAEDK